MGEKALGASSRANEPSLKWQTNLGMEDGTWAADVTWSLWLGPDIIHSMDVEKIAKVLTTDCALVAGTSLVIGVSGGADSLALLDVLHRLGVNLIVAHLNHHLRPEADADARWVEACAHGMDLPCVIGESPVREIAHNERLSVEEAGRNERYRFLFSVARDYRAQAVAVAHTADDQVETVLMHLLRGSGMAGLRGMPYRIFLSQWSPECPLVRPFLGVWRKETEAYCAQRGLVPLVDESNRDTTLYRNRLRRELIPYLEGYNPGFKQHIWQTARLLRDDYELVDMQIQDAWGRCLAGEGANALLFNRDVFAPLAPGLQRGVLRKAVRRLRPDLKDVGYDTVERARSRATAVGRTGERVDLAGGLFLEGSQKEFLIAPSDEQLDAPWWPLLNDQEELALPVPGVVRLAHGWEIAAVEASAGEAPESVFSDRDDVWLDASEIRKPLKVRSRRPGDRFQPFGMETQVNLADFMAAQHVLKCARSRWPLVVAIDGTIVWIPGVRPSEIGRIRTPHGGLLHLSLRKS